MLEKYTGDKYTCLIVNVHETSTGVHYDLNMLHEFCQENHLFFIVDAISSFLADPIDMEKQGIDVLITGSQKALAVPPGISILTLSKKDVYKRQNDDSIASVTAAVWHNEDQSDLQWVELPQNEDGTYSTNVNIANFNFVLGEYHIHVYAVNTDGQQYFLGEGMGLSLIHI